MLALVCSLSVRAETPAVPDLSGRWALLQVTSAIGTIPLLGERTRTARSLSLLDVVQDGIVVSALESSCMTRIDNGTSLVRTDIPDAFLASMPGSLWTAAIKPSALDVGFTKPWSTSVLGASLENPETGPLPTEADDPRVFDQDGDGKPGLTVHVAVMGLIQGDVYVVQRDRSRYTGSVVSGDAVEGLVEWTSEQSVLGASNAFLLAGTASRPDPVSEHSYFVARRVGEDVTCAKLEEMAPTLFDGRWP